MTIHSPCQRTAPFLHRTWLKGVKALQEFSAMGNVIPSSMIRTPQASDGDDTRPAKRRRLSSADSLDLDQLIASPSTIASGSALRIEVLKILHKDSKKVNSCQTSTLPHDVITTKARCRATIFETSCVPPQFLHCQSQFCELVTYKNPVGPHRVARIDLPRPFYVPQESMIINRLDDGRFDLSDSYQLFVELEAANGVPWPPLDSLDFGIRTTTLCPSWGSTQHWTLSSRFNSIVGRLKQSLDLTATLLRNHSIVQTNYVMEVDLRWASSFKSLTCFDRDSKSCINAVGPHVVPYHDSDFERLADVEADGTVDRVNREAFKDHDDGVFLKAQTPSRLLRIRGKTKVYNLKVLSDQAQGREQKRRAKNASTQSIDGRVQYILPPNQSVCLDFFRCVSCGACHDSLVQLQLHLQMTHPTYDYIPEMTNQGPQFRVHVLRELQAPASPDKSFQSGCQIKPSNIHAITSGEQLSDKPHHITPNENETCRPSPSRSQPEPLCSGSPLTKGLKPVVLRRGRKSKPNKCLVPDIRQPLFHPISKARLVAGQEVPETPPDTMWLIQKHRESIADFSDVTAAEKEYIWEWDGYILGKNLTSSAYFPREWLGFVKEKATWLVSEECRMLEFGKHSSILLARDVLDDQTMKHAFACIDEARANLKQRSVHESDAASNQPSAEPALKHSPRSSQIRKSRNGCTVCQLPVLGPILLICSNILCQQRLYHSTCIKMEATMPVTRSKWLCNVCCKDQRLR